MWRPGCVVDIRSDFHYRSDIFAIITARVWACVGARVRARVRHGARVGFPAHFWNSEDLGHRWLAKPQREWNSIDVAPNRFLTDKDQQSVTVSDLHCLLLEVNLTPMFG